MQKHPRDHWKIEVVQLGANPQQKSLSGGTISQQGQKGFWNHLSAQTLQRPVHQVGKVYSVSN